MSSLSGRAEGRRWRWLAMALAVLGSAGCASEAAGPRTGMPAMVSWMEWPAAVSAAAPGSVRIIGTRSQCGTFQLDVVQSGPSSAGVNAVEWVPDPPPPCLALDFLTIFDSMVPLPRLVTPTGPHGSFTLDAVTWTRVDASRRRVFGTIDLAPQPDTVLRAGGRAHLLSDSLGCSWLRREIPGPDGGTEVLSSDVVLGANWVPAFVTGFYATAFSPRCGRTRVFQVVAAEVELSP